MFNDNSLQTTIEVGHEPAEHRPCEAKLCCKSADENVMI